MKVKQSLVISSLFSAAVSLMAQAPSATITPQPLRQLTPGRNTSITATPVGSGEFQLPEVQPGPDGGLDSAVGRPSRANLPIPGKSGRAGFASATLPLPEPVVPGNPVVGYQSPGFLGVPGLTHADQRRAGGGNQFSLEPPDQAFCAGAGYTLEAVNNALRVYDTSGNPVTGIDTMSAFFGLAPEIDRITGVRGPFLSDPKCYYDADTQRWFLTELMEDNGTNFGATGRNYTVIAVSQTSSPASGWTIFFLDVTDDGLNGTPAHPGCPCFGDQPLIGADKYGFYISTNEFGAFFNGSQIYALPKSALAAAADGLPSIIYVVEFDAGPALASYGGYAYSVQPATSPGQNLNNVEFFLSALQFGNPGYEVYDNRIAVWAMLNTSTLNTFPNLLLEYQVINSEVYGQPDPATQKPGPIPLGASLGDPLELLNTNDDRMNQVIYSKAVLLGGVNSKMKVAGQDQTGVAWFGVRPAFSASGLNATMATQGYIAVAGNNVFFPSPAASPTAAAMVFTLSGPSYYPSMAYSVADVAEGGFKQVHVGGPGVAPEDGFSGYPQYGGNGVARWGDYTAAASDGATIWLASEYIPCGSLACRTSLANWGTFFAKITP